MTLHSLQSPTLTLPGASMRSLLLCVAFFSASSLAAAGVKPAVDYDESGFGPNDNVWCTVVATTSVFVDGELVNAKVAQVQKRQASWHPTKKKWFDSFMYFDGQGVNSDPPYPELPGKVSFHFEFFIPKPKPAPKPGGGLGPM